MKIQNTNSWYTILVTLMIIGFLIVITTWILNLVLREMNDNRWAWNYLKAYAWAEAAQELALLQIKKYSYWVYDKKDDLEYLKTTKSKIKISYDLNSKTKSYSWSLKPFEQSVIPLFYLSWTTVNKITDLKLNILNSNYSDKSKMAWNIVSKKWDWVWWNKEITDITKGKWRKSDWSFLDKINISGTNWFLDNYDNNYSVVINLDDTNNLDFELTSTQYFTKPISKIISSAKIWNYKQNLETTLDNTAFLSILKYSVYSK